MKEIQIQLDQEIVTYLLTYKHMQNIRMRVKDGVLCVSAPYGTSLALIETVIQNYQQRLLKQIKAYQPYVQYADGGFILIFNQHYDIVLRDIGVKKCRFHGQCIYVYHQNIKECLDKVCQKLLMEYIEEKVIGYLAHDFDLKMPRIEIKKYKSRWGSCYYKENRITFHLGLIHLEKELIDYVIIHELTHFLYPDHSQQFYAEIQKRMPHYKEVQKRLKEKHT